MSGQIAVRTWDAGSFYERDMAAMSPQQRARWADRHKENSPSEKWQEAREKKQSVNQVRSRRESQTREEANGIMLTGREAFNRHDRHLNLSAIGAEFNIWNQSVQVI